MNYFEIMKHYETCLQEHGDSHLGVDWPNVEDADIRYQVMLDMLANPRNVLLDFGCGASGLYDYVQRQKHPAQYYGADISQQFIDLSKRKYPSVEYYCLDILKEPLPRNFDYIVCNGVFTEKLSLSQDEMWSFFTKVIKKLWTFTEKGLAFNVMSKYVDWERDDLFHVCLKRLGQFLAENLNRRFVVRHDYGLYEFTTYVYKN